MAIIIILVVLRSLYCQQYNADSPLLVSLFFLWIFFYVFFLIEVCESQWTPGVGDGQGGLAYCNSWGRKESDTTERLIWSDLIVDLQCGVSYKCTVKWIRISLFKFYQFIKSKSLKANSFGMLLYSWEVQGAMRPLLSPPCFIDNEVWIVE